MSFGRRVPPFVPQIVGKPWRAIAESLQRFLDDIGAANDNGLPPGAGTDTPTDIVPGSEGSAGDPTSGWANARHEHPVPIGTPVSVGTVNSPGSTGLGVDAGHVHALDLSTIQALILLLLEGEHWIITRENGAVVGLPREVYPFTAEIVNGVDTEVFAHVVPIGAFSSGQIRYALYVKDAAGEQQVQTGMLGYSAANKAGFITTGSIGSDVLLDEALSAGTLSRAWLVTPTSELITITLTATSSLTPTEMVLNFHHDSFDDNEITYP